MSHPNIVILTGAGISAESGIRTFRAADGLWEDHRIEEVATPEGFARNPALVQRMVPSLERAFGKEHVLLVPPVMATDDFARFSQEVPGMFLFLGVVKVGTTSGANHTANFLADDSAVPVGMRALSTMVLDYLRS